MTQLSLDDSVRSAVVHSFDEFLSTHSMVSGACRTKKTVEAVSCLDRMVIAITLTAALPSGFRDEIVDAFDMVVCTSRADCRDDFVVRGDEVE